MKKKRIRIKMCGTTNAENALAAVEAGVDALGFIFYTKSPRAVDPNVAKVIIEQLPPFVNTVGVFVDRKREEVEEIIRFCNLGYAQLHGQESPKYCERLARFTAPCQIIKALRVGKKLQAKDIRAYKAYTKHVKGFLLDTYQQGIQGGTGHCFDWSLIQDLKLQRDIILAGGLDVENVHKALDAVKPSVYALDVNSGVETTPGQKDHNLIKEFIQQVRTWEQSQREQG
ncbi:MAG: phosphoribosylanthranilate isomerase [Candidatus Electrothrix sp. AU1_5]|nr:phosphoribosylanthranilate isomerase [Candidatus Electrothrix gigas]